MIPKRADELYDLARMLIELGDRQQASKSLTASLFALSCLNNTTPRELTDIIFQGVPDDEQWEDQILPALLDYPEDYEHIDP